MCLTCGKRQTAGGWLILDRNEHAVCPSCGTGKLGTRLTPDPIDFLYRSPNNFLKKLLGGTLYKCRFCRLQFYDRRPLQAGDDGSAKTLFSTGEHTA
jgi:hypothetical protein